MLPNKKAKFENKNREAGDKGHKKGSRQKVFTFRLEPGTCRLCYPLEPVGDTAEDNVGAVGRVGVGTGEIPRAVAGPACKIRIII
jgi:hypothetical protein